MRTNNRFPCWLSPQGGGQACFLYGMRVGVCPGVRPEGRLRCFAHPLGGVVCRGHVQYPAFAPGSSKVAVGFFGLFVSFGPEFAPTEHALVIFSPVQFLCILLLEERYVQVQVLQQSVQGPSKGSQVPACLTTMMVCTKNVSCHLSEQRMLWP